MFNTMIKLFILSLTISISPCADVTSLVISVFIYFRHIEQDISSKERRQNESTFRERKGERTGSKPQ